MSQGYTKGIPIDYDGTLSANSDLLVPSQKAVKTKIDTKQDALVSGTNIKTINGDSVLGSGNLVVTGSGASWGSITGTLSSQTDLQNTLDGKVNDTGNETIAGDKTFSGKLIMSGDILTIKDYTTTDSYLSFEDATNSEIGGIYYDSVNGLVDVYSSGVELWFDSPNIVLSSSSINMATASKVTPLDADTVYIKDTASSDEVRQTTWSNVKAFLKTYFDTLYQASGSALTMSQVYPVGSIYTSVVSTNPATLLGVGTWVAFGTGRTLVGIDAGQTEFDTVEETGGAKTHTLLEAEIPSHTHTITDPGHAHTQTTSATDGASGRADSSSGGTVYNNVANINSNTTGITINNTGGGGAHNNLQPYIVVYMWKRTA
jgi:microcystin-dependent protein